MKQEKNEDWTKRYSLEQMTEKAERQIYQVLPLLSQPSEESPSKLHFHVRRFSKPIFPIYSNCTREKIVKKLPPILRYLSQKYMKQVECRKVEEDYLYKGEKKLTINTHSLRKLQPYKMQSPSLQNVKAKRYSNINKNQQEIMARKLQLKKSTIEKKDKQKGEAVETPHRNKFERTIGIKISGWHTQQNNDADVYY